MANNAPNQVLLRTPFLDANGLVSREWVRYFLSLSGGVGGALQVVANLSDLADPSSARSNLGLGTAATASLASLLLKANNLSDLANVTTARGNLGLGTAALHSVGDFLQSALNLADLPSATTARGNLGLGGAALLPDPIPVANGGTGQTTAPAALATLGGASLTANQTLSGTQTISGAIIGSLGGWQAWSPAPTFAASGAMTITASTVNEATFLRIGPICHFHLNFNVTTGGVVNTTIFVNNMPFATAASTDVAFFGKNLTNSQLQIGGFSAATQMSIKNNAANNYILSTFNIVMDGWYRI